MDNQHLQYMPLKSVSYVENYNFVVFVMVQNSDVKYVYLTSFKLDIKLIRIIISSTKNPSTNEELLNYVKSSMVHSYHRSLIFYDTSVSISLL